ncbi:MAG: serine--tRNA ligase, partial [Muribaculaceae bacterium]|nr:serine--tRNA ligase [Muribaculaceae bacterium]
MLTLQQIKANPQDIVRRLAIKGFDGSDEINRLLALDDDRRAAQLNNDNLAAELNKAAAQIGALMKQGDKQQAEEAKKKVAQLKE